jgi:hypothetical protein
MVPTLAYQDTLRGGDIQSVKKKPGMAETTPGRFVIRRHFAGKQRPDDD